MMMMIASSLNCDPISQGISIIPSSCITFRKKCVGASEEITLGPFLFHCGIVVWYGIDSTELCRDSRLIFSGCVQIQCSTNGCSRKFTTIYNLKKHVKLHDLPCNEFCSQPGCEEGFRNKRQLERHMKEHGDALKKYACVSDFINSKTESLLSC